MKCFPGNALAILQSATLLLSLSVPLLQAAPQSPDSQPPKGDAALGERIAGGIVFEGKLWLRGVAGGLVSINLTNDSRQEHFQQGVRDIKRLGDVLWVIRCPSPDTHEGILSVWRKDRFEDIAKYTFPDKDGPVALVGSASGPVVLSIQSIHIFSTDKKEWRKLRLKGKLRGSFQRTAGSPQNGNGVYVGFNTGEWGGGLQQVDVKTGHISNIERRETKELCAGPLNRACDPVTGVIPDPRNKDCVLASVGLVHMMSHGRILRICGKDVSLVFEKTDTVDGFNGHKVKITEAFFGLAASADGGFWGIASAGLYRFAADGTMKEEYPLPKLSTVSGIHLSRDLPGVVVVRTDANWAVSLSGYTPLLISLGDTQLESQ